MIGRPAHPTLVPPTGRASSSRRGTVIAPACDALDALFAQCLFNEGTYLMAINDLCARLAFEHEEYKASRQVRRLHKK